MRVTASKVGLLAYCGWWARAEASWDNRSSAAAERGTRFHSAIAKYVESRTRRDVADDIAEEYACACAWVDAQGSRFLVSEQAFAWDPESDTAEILEVVDRAYRPTARLCGTADLVLLDPRLGSVRVWDFKTGSGADAGPQLRALGLMAARAYGVEEVTVAALEVSKSGVVEVATETLDAFALAGVAGELAEGIAAIATAVPVPGSHCGELYCPARLHCPLGNVAMAEVVEVIPADALTRPREYRLTDPIETPEHAAWALDVCRLVSAKVDAIKDDIKSKVPADGWPLADGRVLRETKATVPAFDKHKALALCKQLGATEAQLAALTYTFEKSNGLRVSGGSAKPRTRRSKAA